MKSWGESWNFTNQSMNWVYRMYLARQMSGRRDYSTYLAGIMAREMAKDESGEGLFDVLMFFLALAVVFCFFVWLFK